MIPVHPVHDDNEKEETDSYLQTNPDVIRVVRNERRKRDDPITFVSVFNVSVVFDGFWTTLLTGLWRKRFTAKKK